MTVKARTDLRITDDYMFGTVMLDTDICRELIEAVLGEPVDRVELSTRQRIVVLNSKGTTGEVDRRLDAFLGYMEDDRIQVDDFTRKVDREVRRLRESDDWYGEYMNFQRRIDDAIAEGRAEGLVEGRAEGLVEGRAEGRAEGLVEGRSAVEDLYARLAQALVERGRADELMAALTNHEYRDMLLAELGIS